MINDFQEVIQKNQFDGDHKKEPTGQHSITLTKIVAATAITQAKHQSVQIIQNMQLSPCTCIFTSNLPTSTGVKNGINIINNYY